MLSLVLLVGKSLLKTSHAELVSASHRMSRLLSVHLAYSLTWCIHYMWGAETSSA